MCSPTDKSFLPDCKATFYQKVASLLIITFCVVIFKFEIISKLSSNFIGGVYGDAGIYVWLSKLFPYQLLTGTWFETNGFFPYSMSLSFSDNWLLPSALAFLLSKLNFEFITSYNLIYILAIISAGYFTFILLYSLTGNFLASILAGVTASHLAPFQHHLGHPQLQHYWILPVTLWLLLKWINSKNPKFIAFSGISLLASFLCSVYLTLFAGYLLIFCILIFLLLRPRYFTGKELIISGFLLSISLLPAIVFIKPYLELQQAFGSRFYYEPWSFQATPASYLSFGPFSWQNILFSFSHSEAHLGIGAILLTLAISGFVMAIWSRAFVKVKWLFVLSVFGIILSASLANSWFMLPTLFSWLTLFSIIYLGFRYSKITANSKVKFFTNQEILFLLTTLTIVFFVLSLGPINSPTIKTFNLYYFFFNFIPGIDGIRSVSRFGLVVNYLCCITGYFVISLLSARKQIGNIAVVCLTFFILAENFTVRFPLEKLDPAPLSFNQYSDKNLVSITLPYGGKLKEDGSIESYFSFAKRNILTVLWGADKNPNLKFINGFSGVKTKIVSELPSAIFDFPSENSLRILSSFVGLNSIIILPEFFENNNSRFTRVDDLLIELNQYKSFFNSIQVQSDKSIFIDFNSRLDLSAPVTLLTDSGSKNITCKLEYLKVNKGQIPLCDPSYFSMVQIPGNKEVSFRCSSIDGIDSLSIFLPPAIKTIPANSIRISTAKLAPSGISLNTCMTM